MKKMLTVLACVLLLVAVLAVSAFAAFDNSSAALATTANELHRGDTFTVDVMVTNEENVSLIAVVMLFDDSALELVDGVCHIASNNPLFEKPVSPEKGTAQSLCNEAVNGKTFTLEFKVKDTAPFGKYDIDGRVALNGAGGYKNSDIPSTGITVTVTCDGVNHEFDQQKAESAFLATPASCTSPALYYKSCVCGAFSTTESATFESGSKLAHTYTKETTNFLKDTATCTHGTIYYLACNDCGKSSQEEAPTATYEVVADKLNHTYDQQNAVKENQATEATCQAQATYYKTCVCGDKSTTETFPYGDFADHVWDKYSKIDATKHSVSCSTPGCTEPARQENHDVSDELIAGDNTHWNACVCGNKANEADHTYAEVADEKFLKDPATCTTKAVYYKSCACGAKDTKTFESGEVLTHVIKPVAAKQPTVTEEGYEAHFQCELCKALYADEKGATPIEKPVAIPKLPVTTEVSATIKGESDKKPLTETQKNTVKEVVQKSSQIHKAENLPADTYLKITVAAATFKGETITKLTYDVTPYTGGVKNSDPGQEITFYLPVPSNTTQKTAAVFHDGKLMGTDYAITTKDGEKFVEVKSSTFSEFTVDLNYNGPAGTGDESLVVASALLLVLSVCGVAAVLVLKKRSTF